MNDTGGHEQDAGLCERCQHAHVVRNDRGSRFILCRLAASDPRFPKYPRLPVRQCAGFTPTARNPE
jgi:hypothetical protein